MKMRSLVTTVGIAVAFACSRARPQFDSVASLQAPRVQTNECEAEWVYQIPRDSAAFYFAELGTGSTRETAMDRAWERTAVAYVRQVAAIVSENVEYVKRHGGVQGTTHAVRRYLSDETMASALELIARTQICRVPEGYKVWELRRISGSLTLSRLLSNDPLARDIDFTNELRRALQRP